MLPHGNQAMEGVDGGPAFFSAAIRDLMSFLISDKNRMTRLSMDNEWFTIHNRFLQLILIASPMINHKQWVANPGYNGW